VPQDTPAGFSNASNAGPSGLFPEGLRVYTLQGPRKRIQVMQSLSLRRSLHWDTVWRSLWPALAAIVVLSVWIGVALRRALRPLDVLSAALLARRSDALTPIELQPCPDELVTPVQSLNDLLRRLDLALQTQRRFTGDAAHELRTPLAALRLQAQNLAESTDLSTRQAQGRELLRGIDRCTHLISQLLALARQDERAQAEWMPVSLRNLARDALIDHAAEAASRDVELALEEGPDASVQGHAGDLQRLLGNLLANAIRHAPPGSGVSVAVAPGATGAVLRVVDDGPGMPPQDRARAFDRFFRGEHASPGAGLGLAIVQQIAERHGAQVSLQDKASGSGLVAEVRFTQTLPSPRP
jgi:two-component system, OmpR family, sensor kinase